MISTNSLYEIADSMRDPHRLVKMLNPLRRSKNNDEEETVQVWAERCFYHYNESLDWLLRANIIYYDWDNMEKLGSMKRECRQMFVNPDNNPLILKSIVELDSLYFRIERMFYGLLHQIPPLARKSIPALKETLFSIESDRLDEWSEDAYSFGLVVLLTQLHEIMHRAYTRARKKSHFHPNSWDIYYRGKDRYYEDQIYKAASLCVAILTLIKGICHD